MTDKRIDWPAPEVVQRAYDEAGTEVAAAERLGVSREALRHFRREHKLKLPGPRRKIVDTGDPDQEFAQQLHARLKRKEHSVEGLADELEVPPKRIRETIEKLRTEGYRIPEEEARIRLERVVPNKTKVHKSLLEGDELTVGLVSDTHLGSNEEALGELELAYDTFADEGITEVWHPGDWITGLGIFRTQASEIHKHTLDEQIEYCVKNYPSRKGMQTVGISGNHDWGGEAARAGLDPARAIANQRADITYLNPTSAWVELPNGAFVHLLHGSGAMSYSVDYKALKLVDGYVGGEKPAVLCVGHWHKASWQLRRNVHVVFPGCFEWSSPFLQSKGLSPDVGFFILRMTLADDGSIVRFTPQWHHFFKGRHAI